jgi:hypothetical protein
MSRDQIIEHLQPLFDELVDRVAALVPELVHKHLVETLGKLTDAPAKPTRSRKVARPAVKPAKSAGRKPNSCSKCGATGFTAATCGKTHNVDGKPATAPYVVAKPPPLNSGRNDRFAAIEAAARARRGE